MPIYDIMHALDYNGGVPTAGQFMAADANGIWTASTVNNITATGTINLTGVNASNGRFGNSINATGVNASIGNVPSVYIATLLSVGNQVVQASGASLGFFKAPTVGQQASVSVEKANYTSVDAANSVTVMNALNALASGINSIGNYLNTLGFTA